MYKPDLAGVMYPNSLTPAAPLVKPVVTFVLFNKSLLSGALGDNGKLHRMFKSTPHVSENTCKFKCPLFAKVVVVFCDPCLVNLARICCPVFIKTANPSNLKKNPSSKPRIRSSITTAHFGFYKYYNNLYFALYIYTNITK